ncbi:MAG: GNAT family N-acetyltransferase [Chloroflexi bacterium]|nr:GNAT family N-acetyltransferase [Chloroflexota bacterium]
MSHVSEHHPGYTLRECAYADVLGLVEEADRTEALLQRRSDDAPFHRIVDQVYGGHHGYQVFVLTDASSRPVGFTMTLPEADARTVSIGPTFISRSLRGKGLGKRMILDIIEWARVRGMARLLVATWGSNRAARGTFEAVGFRFTDEELNTRVNGDSTVTYELALANAVVGN